VRGGESIKNIDKPRGGNLLPIAAIGISIIIIVINTMLSVPPSGVPLYNNSNNASSLDDDEYTAWYMCREEISKTFSDAAFQRTSVHVTEKDGYSYQVDAFFAASGKKYTFVCKIDKISQNRWVVRRLEYE
jgi:hypothetical protein